MYHSAAYLEIYMLKCTALVVEEPFEQSYENRLKESTQGGEVVVYRTLYGNPILALVTLYEIIRSLGMTEGWAVRQKIGNIYGKNTAPMYREDRYSWLYMGMQ